MLALFGELGECALVAVQFVGVFEEFEVFIVYVLLDVCSDFE